MAIDLEVCRTRLAKMGEALKDTRRLIHSMPAAQLFFLKDDHRLMAQRGAHLGNAMPGHDNIFFTAGPARTFQQVSQHRPPANRLQRFGQTRTHARAFARGQNDGAKQFF